MLKLNLAGLKNRVWHYLVPSLIFLSTLAYSGVPTEKDLDTTFSSGQWNDVVQMAHEMISKGSPAAARTAKLRGAYALFQKSYPNAALLYLKQLSPSDWKLLPQGQDRFVEIVSLFQKKVPFNILPGRLEQVDVNSASPLYLNEIHFAKGREAFMRGDYAVAKQHLDAIARGSRFFGPARYIIGSIQVANGNYKAASDEFSKIFDSAVFEQSNEFWQDLGTSMTTHWGANLKVMLDAGLLETSNLVGELALLALARIAFATHDYEIALERYGRVSPKSKFYSKANLEKIWTLLAMNRHEDAQEAAKDLSTEGTRFESVEALTVRALVLTDIGRTDEARSNLAKFSEVYEKSKSGLEEYLAHHVETSLPIFLKSDIEEDVRIQTLKSYESKLQEEIVNLHKEDQNLFPAYSHLASDLLPMITQVKGITSKLVEEHIRTRLADLAKLYIQSKLITAETYLEDREKLRKEFKDLKDLDEKKQNEHDERLVNLLAKAVKEADQAISLGSQEKSKGDKQLRLEFRQSELLWELSRTEIMLTQVRGQKDTSKYDAEENRAIKIAEDIAFHYPRFAKNAEALFFSGFAELETGDQKKAINTLQLYVHLYPKHVNVPDAYRILADIRFDNNDFRGAEDYYKKILEFQESPVLGYALYKIGWCGYNEHDYAKALLGLEKAIVWTQNKEKTNQLLSLKNEAKRDLISVYSEVGDHLKALDYFRQFVDNDISSWILDLAKQLDTIGQFEKSGDLYHILVSLEPNSQNNILYQASIIFGNFKLHRWDKVTEATQELVTKYREQIANPPKSEKEKSKSEKKNGDEEEKEDPAISSEKIVRDVTLGQHFEFRKSELDEDTARILALDNLYLKAFHNWPTSQGPLYEHAKFLAEKEKFSEAVDSFKEHWLTYRDSLKEPVREEALRNLIHALEQNDEKTKGSRIEDIVAFTNEYNQLYPKTKYARAISFLRSAILFKYGKTLEGMKEAQALFDADPADDFGKRSFKNLRLAYYTAKNWQSTYQWASDLLTKKTKGMSDYTADLKAIRKESLFLWAQNEKDEKTSVSLFLKIADDSEMQSLRDKSLYNAFIHYQKADKKTEALQIADRLEKVSPDYEGLPQIAGIRAAYYQDAGDYNRSLPLMLIFLSKHDSSVAPDVLEQARLNAALMLEATEKTKEATALFKEYLSNSKDEKTPGAVEAKRGIERIANRNKTPEQPSFKDWPTVIKTKSDFEKQPLPKWGDLASRIKKGGLKLEGITKSFIQIAGNPKTPAFFAYETYCSLPFLYEDYSNAVMALGKKDEELKKELAKVVAPVNDKVTEMANECLKRSAEAEHDGPVFKQVLGKWGWQADPSLKQAVAQITEKLQKLSPWMDPSNNSKSETDIIQDHLTSAGTPGTDESWYALAKLRWDGKKIGMSRLTFVNALARAPKPPISGKILNALVCIEQTRPNAIGISPLFEKAAAEGSTSAWANIALIHLKADRLEKGKAALRHGLESGVFKKDSELNHEVEELIKNDKKS